MHSIFESKSFLILLFISIFASSFYCKIVKLNKEKQLITHLIDNYQVKYGRPVNNMTEKITVFFECQLIQIIDLDERNQVLITNMLVQYVWIDQGLKWNTSDFAGIDHIHLPVKEIWTPDIVLYNYADTRLEEKREVLATVSSDGKVKWSPPSIFKSTCQINIQMFPYDEQNCSMKFGSWTYHKDSIDIQFLGNSEMNTELYLVSNEWEIVSTRGKRTEIKYECCAEIFPDITYFMQIKRKGGFYNYSLVLPCFLLTCLTVVLFWLPPESPAKMVLGMNIFTSFFVLLLLLSKNIPSATETIPLIGAYYCINMVMIATSTCSCTIVVHIFFRGQGQVPPLLRKIFLQILARIYCMTPSPAAAAQPAQYKPPTNNKSSASIVTSAVNIQGHQTTNRNSFTQSQIFHNQQSNSMVALNENDDLIRAFSQTSQIPQSVHIHEHQQNKQLNNELNLSFNLIENDIKEIRDYLRHTRKKLESSDAKTKQTGEWKQVALVLDRTLFYLYVIATVVAGCLMVNR